MTNPIIESASQIAARLGVTTRTINRRIKKGTMVAHKHPSPGRNGFVNLFITPVVSDKTDVYAAAQDLGERLARQIEINQALRAENVALASSPCLECDIILPELRDRADLLEAELRGALCMLDLVKIEQSSLYVGTIEQFIRDRDELNETFKRLTSAQNA